MSSTRLLGCAVVCFALGLGDLALLNLWGIGWAWPALAGRPTAAGFATHRSSAVPYLVQTPDDQASAVGEDNAGDKDLPATHDGSFPESSELPPSLVSSAQGGSVPDPVPAAAAGQLDAAVAEPEAASNTPDSQGLVAQVRPGGAPPALPPPLKQSTDFAKVVGSEAEQQGDLSDPDPDAAAAAVQRANVEAQRPSTKPDADSGSTPVQTTLSDPGPVDEGRLKVGAAGDGTTTPEGETTAAEGLDSQAFLEAPVVVRPQTDEKEGTVETASSASPELGTITEADLVVEFATDEYALSAKHVAALQGVVAVLRRRPELYAKVEGHTDRRGSLAYNQRLSERRAEAVASFLLAMGIAGERIETSGYGRSRPIDSTNNARSWARNRRVEVRMARR